MEFSGAAPGEGPHNARMEGSTQLSCSVKEEPSADGQHVGEGECHTKTVELCGESVHIPGGESPVAFFFGTGN